jgi:hypothetical protein
MVISSRLALILACSLFNILFEYSARGITELARSPLLFLFMFGIYFSYFAMFEDLMARFRLNNFQIVLFGMIYGTLPEAFLTGNLFNRSIFWGFTVAGVNVGSLILISLCAWGVLQGNITFYFANRFRERDWGHSKMGVFGWSAAILFQLIMIILAWRNPVTPRGTAAGYIFLIATEVTLLSVFVFTLRRHRHEKTSAFVSLPTMDVLAFVSVGLFLVLGTFFSHGETIVTSRALNRGPVVVEMTWTIIVATVFFLYRILRKQEIRV